MWPDRVSNPRPLTYESGALPTALRGPAQSKETTSRLNKMASLRFYVIFNSISIISGRWVGENERMCVIEPRLRFKRFSLPGIDLGTARSSGQR